VALVLGGGAGEGGSGTRSDPSDGLRVYHCSHYNVAVSLNLNFKSILHHL
jgi:hypothetical protein